MITFERQWEKEEEGFNSANRCLKLRVRKKQETEWVKGGWIHSPFAPRARRTMDEHDLYIVNVLECYPTAEECCVRITSWTLSKCLYLCAILSQGPCWNLVNDGSPKEKTTNVSLQTSPFTDTPNTHIDTHTYTFFVKTILYLLSAQTHTLTRYWYSLYIAWKNRLFGQDVKTDTDRVGLAPFQGCLVK